MNMDIGKIVMKLIGPIEPTGDHSEDKKRLDNITELINVVDYLIGKLSVIEHYYRNDKLDSKREISEYISTWLNETKKWLNKSENH